MKGVIISLSAAFVMWALMFSPLTAPYFNFWYMMACAALLLSVLMTVFDSAWPKRLSFSAADAVYGILIAVVLWGIFWCGDKVAGMLFTFARPEVDAIYAIKGGMSPWLLSILLLVLVGPAEEIFWRGFVQEHLSRRWNPDKGFVVTTLLYAAVHAASCNFMLVMAALVAGTVWGAFYRFFPNRLAAAVISHALWDAAVFIWFPIL